MYMSCRLALFRKRRSSQLKVGDVTNLIKINDITGIMAPDEVAVPRKLLNLAVRVDGVALIRLRHELEEYGPPVGECFF